MKFYRNWNCFNHPDFPFLVFAQNSRSTNWGKIEVPEETDIPDDFDFSKMLFKRVITPFSEQHTEVDHTVSNYKKRQRTLSSTNSNPCSVGGRTGDGHQLELWSQLKIWSAEMEELLSFLRRKQTIADGVEFVPKCHSNESITVDRDEHATYRSLDHKYGTLQ